MFTVSFSKFHYASDGITFSGSFWPHSALDVMLVCVFVVGQAGIFYTRHKVTLQCSGTRVFRVGCSESTQVPLFPETTLLEGAAGGTLLGCSQPAGLDSVKKEKKRRKRRKKEKKKKSVIFRRDFHIICRNCGKSQINYILSTLCAESSRNV